LFDGSDGIAGVQAFVGLLFLGIACAAQGVGQDLPVITALAGSVVGILFFNWPAERTRRLRTFMGDAGSTMLGFALAWWSIKLSQGPERTISPGVVLWVF